MSKSKARTFNVVFEPDDGGWHAWIPSVQGCRTWGRSLVTVRRGIREALAACVDVFGDDAERVAKAAEFDEEFKLPAEAKRELARRTKAMQRARAAETAPPPPTPPAAQQRRRPPATRGDGRRNCSSRWASASAMRGRSSASRTSA